MVTPCHPELHGPPPRRPSPVTRRLLPKAAARHARRASRQPARPSSARDGAADPRQNCCSLDDGVQAKEMFSGKEIKAAGGGGDASQETWRKCLAAILMAGAQVDNDDAAVAMLSGIAEKSITSEHPARIEGYAHLCERLGCNPKSSLAGLTDCLSPTRPALKMSNLIATTERSTLNSFTS